MATQVISEPILLDSTGQDIVEALGGIANAVQPVNIFVDVEITIPSDGWSESVPHRYTWHNQRVTTECGVEVHFKNGAENVAMDFLTYEKVIGGIEFETNEIPDGAVPLVVRIINAEADTIVEPTGADQVTTDAVPECSNVQEALANHENRISTNSSEIDDLEDDVSDIYEELDKRVQFVNSIPPDEHGNIDFNEVEFARQIVTDDAQQSTGEFLFRTTGGEASLSDGPAKLVSISGRSVHTGIVEESINMTVTMATREEGQDPIEAVLDRAEFVEAMADSGTLTLSYTSDWSDDPSDYGITVTGTPITGDQIVVVYVKADRGLITNSNPSSFTSTGWNLYDHSAGYARVKKYSSSYGFLIGGTYSGIQFSETIDGEKETLTPASGYFTVPSDGYVWVSNGDGTTTYILMTWSDWGEGYEGDWKAYEESTISLSTIMANFPYGLMQVGAIADEINFSMKRAISRIERLAYTDENLATVIASGQAYDADEDYIYAVKASEDIYVISATGDYTACDHGLEIIDGGTVDVYVRTLYGQNLVDKLRTDVLTKSNDLVNNLATNDATKALSAAQGYALNSNLNSLNNRFKTITSGSLHDIKTTGMYYLTGGVTDKPVNNGGYYSVTAYNSDLVVGIYTSTDGYVFNVVYMNSAWVYKELAQNSNLSSIFNATLTATDLNSVPAGLSFTNADTSNSPGAFSVVFTMVRDANASVQLALRTSIDAVYYRRKSGGTWNAWKTLTFQ